MRLDDEYQGELTRPLLLEKSRQLLTKLRSYDLKTLQGYLKCNDRLAYEAFQSFQQMQLEPRYPALLTYDGISFKYMAPHVFDEQMMAYANKHVRIISGLYGLLRPLDGIEPYRLEMQTKMDLYGFWGDDIYRALDDHVVINLASKEYDVVIKKYLTSKDTLIDVSFCQLVDGKPKEKGVYVKMARGDLVAYMCKHQVTSIDELKAYDGLGYHFSETYSTPNHIVFLNEIVSIPKKI